MTTLAPTKEDCRILVVDDDEDIRVALGQLLASCGHDVLGVGDARQALTELERGAFDIVLTDIRMPGMDGIDLAAWVKRNKPHTDVIVMTGYASIDTAAEALHVGALDYLLKPFTNSELVTSTIERAAERRQLEAIRSEFVERVLAAQDEERRRIARELHDETGQALTSVVLGIRALEVSERKKATSRTLGDLRQITEATMRNVSRLARGLHPTALDDLGFAAAIEHHARDYAEMHGLTLDLHVTGFDGGYRLPAPVEIALYRVVQEALTNIAKHAGARLVSVVADLRPAELRLTIEDDGCGISTPQQSRSAPSWHPPGLGLVSMRERIALLRGTLAIESRPEGGTTLLVRVPLEVPRHG